MPSRWVLVDLLTRKIKLRCIRSTVSGTIHYLFEIVRIRIRIKQSDPDLYKIEKQDPDLYQIESRIRIRIKVKSRIRTRIRIKKV